MGTSSTIDAMRVAARALHENRPAGEQAVAIQTAQDALDAAKADAIGRLEDSRGFEDDGYSSIGAWVRERLRLPESKARELVRAGRTLTALPEIGRAAAAGRIRLDHVAQLTFGLKHLGHQVMGEAEQMLLDVALTHDAVMLGEVVKALRSAVYPDELDAAWVRGMEKSDIRVVRVADGYHVTGFLDAITGTKLKTVLDSLSVPREAGDLRTPAERRVDGLDQMLTRELEHGLPGDRGVRPHLSVTVDADTLAETLSSSAPDLTGLQPGELAGFGAIGAAMIAYIACGADLTPLLIAAHDDPNAFTPFTTLDHGRTKRYGTLKQRRAIEAMQHGQCGGACCHGPIQHLHHIDWHSHGGPTDLANLVGLCNRCHVLVHQGKLKLTRRHQQITFADTTGKPLDKRVTVLERQRTARALVHQRVNAPMRR